MRVRNQALMAQRSGAKRGAVASVVTIPAPVRGLNARDAIAAMKPTDAIMLDNIVPGTSDVGLRLGYRRWATGLGGPVESIMPYRSAANAKQFAAAGGKIFDATTQGAVGAAVVTGLTNSRLEHINFGTPGGQFLLAVNGADPMRIYNGTNWITAGLGAGAVISSISFVGTTATVTTATPHGLSPGNTITVTGAVPAAYNVAGVAITIIDATRFSYTMASTPATNATTVGAYTYALTVTGFDTSKAITINAFGQRVWFIEKNSFRAWYLGIQSIAGAATQLDLSSLFKLGGSLAGMLTWTVAGETATQQYAVFVSTQGEVVIYSGYDPANTDFWALVGTARIGAPIGTRFWAKVGTDVVLITADGFVPLSDVLQLDRKSNADAISNRIVNAASSATSLYGTNFGWQVVLYPGGNKLIVNVPQVPDGTSVQYVMNTITGAWCRYTGINANCWAETQTALYFGGNGIVYQGEYGNNDDGASIIGVCVPAFNYFGSQGRKKRFTQIKPVIVGAGAPSVITELLLDLAVTPLTTTPPLSAIRDAPHWTTSPWGSHWKPATRVTNNWQGASGIGESATARISFNLKNATLSIEAISYMFELGGYL
jgi:hypothetical protein